MRAHPNWWVFSLLAGGIVLGSVSQELWDYRLSGYLVFLLGMGFGMGHLFWCGETPVVGGFSLGIHRNYWAVIALVLSAAAGFGAVKTFDLHVVYFLVALPIIGFILGHIFWCVRPPLGYNQERDGRP